MKKMFVCVSLLMLGFIGFGQKVMTTEMLLQLGKVNGMGISKNGKSIIYSVKTYSLANDKNTTVYYAMPVTGGISNEIKDE